MKWVALFILVGCMIGGAWYWFGASSQETAPTRVPLPSATVTPAPTKVLEFSDQVKIAQVKTVAQLTTADIYKAQRSFLRKEVATEAATITVLNIWFTVPRSDAGAEKSRIKAQVFVPHTDQKNPVLVYGSGTTGLAPHCAPSLEKIERKNIGNYYNQMVSLASLGYVVVFPDYDGFASKDDTQPYFVADLEARVLLGSLQALYQQQRQLETLASPDFSQTFLMGYSQGGHAALAAAAKQDWLSPDITIKGVIGYAPAYDVQALLQESPHLAPYLVYAYFKHYQLDPKEQLAILAAKHTTTLETDVLSRCVDSMAAYYSARPEHVYQPKFWAALKKGQPESVAPGFARAVQANQVPEWETQSPLLIIQGEKDTIVTPKTQRDNLRTFCDNKMKVSYVSLAGANHFQTPAQGTLLAHRWMQSVIDGQTDTDCPSLPES